MQMDNTIQEKSLKNLIKKRKITVANSYLQRLKQRFAFATIVIPLLGSIVAIGLLGLLPISSVEIRLLVSLHTLIWIGTNVGFHRYFAHRAFETSPVIQIILVILGSMAAQGPLINWVATHRRHHQYSDQPEDPHSPHFHEGEKLNLLHGLWHSHLGWILNGKLTNSMRFAKDLIQNSTIVKLNRLYLVWVFLGLAIPTVLGGVLTWTWLGAVKGFLWGGLVRLFLGHHFNWINASISHIYGTRPFDTPDQSRNNIWASIPSLGEGWHNNHHAFPNSAIAGLEWWQFDFSGWVIRALEKLGLAWDVKVPTAKMIEAKKVAEGA